MIGVSVTWILLGCENWSVCKEKPFQIIEPGPSGDGAGVAKVTVEDALKAVGTARACKTNNPTNGLKKTNSKNSTGSFSHDLGFR